MLVKHNDSQYVHFSCLGWTKIENKNEKIPTYRPIIFQTGYSKHNSFFFFFFCLNNQDFKRNIVPLFGAALDHHRLRLGWVRSSGASDWVSMTKLEVIWICWARVWLIEAACGDEIAWGLLKLSSRSHVASWISRSKELEISKRDVSKRAEEKFGMPQFIHSNDTFLRARQTVLHAQAFLMIPDIILSWKSHVDRIFKNQ